jgi:NADH-quinone oxidoreductase subunit N
MTITGTEFHAICTPLLLSLLVVGGLLLEILFWKDRPRLVGIFTLIGLVVIFAVQTRLQVEVINMKEAGGMAVRLAFNGSYFFDLYSILFNYIFLIAAIVATVLSLTYLEGREDNRGEYYLLLCASTIGMCLMAAAHDLLILFLGLEIMSIAIYVLVGIERQRPKSGEASIKYLLLGAFGSAFLLYGMAILYGLTGHIDYLHIADGLNGIIGEAWRVVEVKVKDPADAEFFSFYLLLSRADKLALEPRVATSLFAMFFGVGFILVGFFFKVAAVPFHMWTPDVYEGAPTPITAFMATGVKAAAFAGLVRLGITALSPLWGLGPLYQIVAAAAILTMTLGNVVAIAQRNVKRMLAYSSIAHAGYLLVGVTALIASGQFATLLGGDKMTAFALGAVKPILFYLIAYTFMNLGAFGVIVVLGLEKNSGETLADFAGLGLRRPGLAAIMALCMLSLAGVPPLVGFAGKFYIFHAAVENRLYLLAIIGVLNSVVSAYYYLRVLVVMYMQPETEPLTRPGFGNASGAMVANIFMAALVVMSGLAPELILRFLSKALDIRALNLPIF